MSKLLKRLSLGFVLISTISSGFAAPNDSSVKAPDADIQEYKNLKQADAAMQTYIHCGGFGDGHFMRDQILKNLDAECLSSSSCEVALAVTIAPDGTPTSKKVFSKNDTPLDDFYCEQAVWEYASKAPGFAGNKILCEFSKETAGSHPELRNADRSHVKLHLIPSYFYCLGLTFPECEVANSNNVIELKVDKLNDPMLADFRQGWMEYFRGKPPTYQEIKYQASLAKRKYSDLFN